MQGEFIFEGKKYISASRASKICGYTSDYIGQLCRKGALDCRMVGRSWFVEEVSIKNHKVVASSTPRGRIPFYQKNAVLKAAENSARVSTQNLTQDSLATTEHAFHSAQQEWVNFINESKDQKQVRGFAVKIGVGIFVVMLLVTASSVFLTNKSTVFTNPLSIIGTEKISNFKNETNSALVTFRSSQNDVGSSLAYSANVFDSLSFSLREKTNGIIRGAYSGLAFINNFLFDTSRKVRVLVMNSEPRERTGVAVLPASKSDAVNEQVKQYVTDSFSDEVEIVPDESGNSGLIKPVFQERDKDDQGYVYVIVPMKEGPN